MDTVKGRRVPPLERRTLRRWKRSRLNRIHSCRARVILLFAGRTRNKEIAERVGCTPERHSTPFPVSVRHVGRECRKTVIFWR